MMHPDMLLLAERLVEAMESMAQNVKSMSAYVYDISCSVSYLLNEKRENGSISVAPYHEGDNPTSVTTAQYEQGVGTSSSYIQNPVNGESFFGYIAPTNIDPHENSDALSSESNSVLTGRMKEVQQAEVEVHDESSDAHNMYGSSRNNISKETKSETTMEVEEEDLPRGMHTTISHSEEQMSPLCILETIEHGSAYIRKEIQQVATSSTFTSNSDYSTMLSRIPEGQISVTGIHQMVNVMDSSVVHTGVQSEKRTYKCSFCGITFKKKYNLQVHTRVHTGEKPFKCNMCGKAFKQKVGLTRHVRFHTGEKPYRCNVCGKSFTQTSCLSLHRRSHTGEKPFKCNMCGKAFKQKDGLTRHVRFHTGEKPYRCNVCGKSFTQTSSLSLHRRSHTGEKPFKCNMCGKAFMQKGHLTYHLRCHMGVKPYKCNLCNQAFRNSYSLKQHISAHSQEHLNSDFRQSV